MCQKRRFGCFPLENRHQRAQRALAAIQFAEVTIGFALTNLDFLIV
jgi:hypothetical protein